MDTTGLTHLGARECDPALGRFVSVDPVMDLTDPVQWVAYAYADDTPVTMSDPTGELGSASCGAGVVGGPGACTGNENGPGISRKGFDPDAFAAKFDGQELVRDKSGLTNVRVVALLLEMCQADHEACLGVAVMTMREDGWPVASRAGSAVSARRSSTSTVVRDGRVRRIHRPDRVADDRVQEPVGPQGRRGPHVHADGSGGVSMTADLGGITDRLRDRWEGLGIDGSFRQTVTFLLGWDAGQDGRALAGFREWLVVRFGDGNNLGWPGLVANLAAAGSGVPVATLRAHGGPGGEPGGPAVQTLLDLLEEFLRARDSSPIGLTVILSAYTDWLRAQPWYEGSTEWAALDKGRR